MSSAPEPKACPFCGKTDIGVKDNIINGQCFAYCRSCQATGPFIQVKSDKTISRWRDDPERLLKDEEIIREAYLAWNKRNRECV